MFRLSDSPNFDREHRFVPTRDRGDGPGLRVLDTDHFDGPPFQPIYRLVQLHGDGRGGIATETLSRSIRTGGSSWLVQLVTGSFASETRLDSVVVWPPASTGALVDIDYLPEGLSTDLTPERYSFPPDLELVANAQAGDVNGDGRDDLVLVVSNRFGGCCRKRLVVLTRSVAGGWRTLLDAPFEARNISRVAVAEVDGDQYEDVVLLSTGADRWFGSPLVLLGGGVPSTTVVQPLSTAFPLLDIGSGDFDGDGQRELVALEGVLPSSWIPTSAALHRVRLVDGRLESIARTALDPASPEPTLRISGIFDLNLDRRDDVVLWRRDQTAYIQQSFQIYYSRADRFIQGPHGEERFPLLGVLDLNGDRAPEPVLNGYLGLILGQERGGAEFDFGADLTPLDGSIRFVARMNLAAGDLNGDGLDDVVGHDFQHSTLMIGIARGDGTFHQTSYQDRVQFEVEPSIRDFDGDGQPEILVPPSESWGNSDILARVIDVDEAGQPDSEPREWRSSSGIERRFVGNFVGDARLDVVTQPSESPSGEVRLEVWGGQSTGLRSLGTIALADQYYEFASLVADLDNDGYDDLILTPQPVKSGLNSSLIWLRSQGDGAFETQLLTVPASPYRVSRLLSSDLDRDGIIDLLVGPYPDGADLLALRNDGHGGLEPLAAVRMTSHGYAHSGGRLIDVDQNGLDDIVWFFGDREQVLTLNFNVRGGLGVGEFAPPSGTEFVEPGQLWGRFRRNAPLEPVGISEIDGRRRLIVGRSGSRVLDEDMLPPTTTLHVRPAPGSDPNLPIEIGASWRLYAIPEDECDSHPSVIDRRVELPKISASSSVSFKRSTATEFRIYEQPQSGRRSVLLLGPNESESRQLFEAVRLGGGVPFEQGRSIRVQLDAHWGSERSPADPAARLTHRVELERGRLTGIDVHRPQADLMVLMRSQDASGKRGETRASFLQSKQAAGSALCALAQVLPGLRCQP